MKIKRKLKQKKADQKLRLNIRHKKELEASGITLEMAIENGVRSIDAEEARKLLKRKSEIGPGLLFQYLSENGSFEGVCNFKPDTPLPSIEEGKSPRKYVNPIGQECRFYILDPVRQKLLDSSVDVYITEGSKKVLKAVQEGYLTIGVSGVWNWFKDKSPISDFDLVAWKDRIVYLAFDGDKFSNDSVLLAEQRLAEELILRGANVRIINFPNEKGLDKLDDYLVKKGNSEFNVLCKCACSYSNELLSRMPENIIASELDKVLQPIIHYLALLSESAAKSFLENELKFNLSDRCNYKLPDRVISSLCKDIDKVRKEKVDQKPKPITQEDLKSELKNEGAVTAVHPAQDFVNGVMYFYAPFDKRRCLISSDRRIVAITDLDKEGLYANPEVTCRSGFSKQGVADFLDGKSSVNAFTIYESIKNYLERYISFTDSDVAVFLALWIMGTYCFKVFRYYPYIWVNAPKNSGKTLLMEVMSSVAFNSCLAVNTTMAVVFRSVNHNLCALFLDEAENLISTNKTERGELISLLNSGFSSSGHVQRTKKDSVGNFNIEDFSSFSPKMFGSIKKMDSVLETRAVKIPYMRKRPTDQVERFKETDKSLKERKKIKDSCYVFALDNASKIHSKYININKDGIEHLLDRDLDIWEPIFILASIVDDSHSQNNESVLQKVIGFSRKLIHLRKDEEVTNDKQKLVLRVLRKLLSLQKPERLKGGAFYFKANDVLDFFKKEMPELRFSKTNTLTHLLKPFRIISTQMKKKNSDSKIRIYKFDMKHLKNWIERYGS